MFTTDHVANWLWLSARLYDAVMPRFSVPVPSGSFRFLYSVFSFFPFFRIFVFHLFSLFFNIFELREASRYSPDGPFDPWDQNKKLKECVFEYNFHFFSISSYSNFWIYNWVPGPISSCRSRDGLQFCLNIT